ncbi:MAG: hypothetical protein ABW044_12190 [Cellvibrio sp.]
MKIFSAILLVLLIATGVSYVSLYLDYENLESEFTLQKNDYEKLQEEYDEALKNSGNTRLVNPYGQMTTKQSGATTNTNAPAPANRPIKKSDEFSNLQNENLARTLDQKYSILFTSLTLSKHDQEKMRELLMERERILGTSSVGYFTSEADIKANIEKQQELVSQIDRQIAQLLKPDEVKKYELLKDSSYEQFQMNSFYDRLGDRGSLTEQKKNTLLLSKLEQKQAFATLLQNSANDIAGASQEEKKFLSDKMHEALHDYKDNYLRTAKDNLSEEQFNVLREYEQQQFEEIWQSLQAGWQIEQ